MVTIYKDFSGRIQRAGGVAGTMATGTDCCCPTWCDAVEAIHRIRAVIGSIPSTPAYDPEACGCDCADYGDTTYTLIQNQNYIGDDECSVYQNDVFPNDTTDTRCCSARVFGFDPLSGCELIIEVFYILPTGYWSAVLRTPDDCFATPDSSRWYFTTFNATAGGVLGTFTMTGGAFPGTPVGFCQIPTWTLIVE